jgi:hypothetical protein
MRSHRTLFILTLTATLVITEICFGSSAGNRTVVAHGLSITLHPILAPHGFGVQDTGAKTNSDHPRGYYPYDIATSPDANWGVIAWTNPVDQAYLNAPIYLPDFDAQRKLRSRTWISSSSPVANQKMALVWTENLTSGTTAQILYQSGINDIGGCTDSQGNPLEYDFFVAPNSKGLDPYHPSAYLNDEPNPPTNPFLNQITALTIEGSVELLAQMPTTSPGQCAVNQSGLLYALIFNNPVHHQTLYYQLDLNGFCYAGPDPAYNEWCKTTPHQMSYFFTGANNEWGIDDPITNYLNSATHSPYSLLGEGGTDDLALDFLPRIAYLIQHGEHGLDTDLSHWQVGAIYFGQHTWGSSALVSKWSSANFAPTIVYTPAN